MRTLTLSLLLVLSLGACHQRKGEEPPVGDAAAICYMPDDPIASIDGDDTGVRWTCNASKAECFDELGERVIPALASKALSEARGRQACVRFIDTLRERGRFRSTPEN